MSDIGKLHRPEATAMDASELGHESPGAVLDDPAAARERAGGELKFRASGGANGVAPMQRLMDERRAMGGRLATRVQRKAEGGGGAGGVEIPEGGGAKLSSAVRAKMEPKLGADLGDVQVHTGGASAKAAAGLGARAFTVGTDVHFNSGEFAPGSKEGDRLLAHELTHVVQGKKSGIQRKADEHGGEHEKGGGEVSHPDEPAEKEADAVADGVTDQLHGGKDAKGGAGGKAKGKGKDDDKKGAHGGGGDHGAEAHEAGGPGGEHGGGHEAAHVVQQGGGQAAGAKGEGPAEKPAPISAKFVGVGRKIFRAPKPNPAPNNATPPGPKKPSTDPEYQALPGWAEFMGNCGKIGVAVPMALGFWKSCMDQLFVNEEAIKKLSGDKKAILEYVDSVGARTGFSQFAEAMFAKFPLDMKANYALWSGKNAYKFAQTAGCQVLEGTQLGSVFNDVKTAFSGDWNVMKTLWRAISDAYARKIAAIMAGKNIKVFHRKQGDIFAEVESKAVKEVTDKTKTKINYEFHALLTPGMYNFEADYDGTPNNDAARKDVTAAAGGDEKKAQQACNGKVKIFDYPGGAPPEAMHDLGGVVGSETGSLARLQPNNADVTAKLDAIKKELTSKKKP